MLVARCPQRSPFASQYLSYGLGRRSLRSDQRRGTRQLRAVSARVGARRPQSSHDFAVTTNGNQGIQPVLAQCSRASSTAIALKELPPSSTVAAGCRAEHLICPCPVDNVAVGDVLASSGVP